MTTLSESQVREVERLAEAKKATEYECGMLHAFMKATNDPHERRRIEQALAKHDPRRKAS